VAFDELRLTGIHLYPIKGLGGITVQTAEVLPKGLRYDRRFMLIDQAGNAMTQRVFPKMALFSCYLKGKLLMVSYGDEAVTFPAEPASFINEQSAGIWEQSVTVNEVTEELSQWFSQKLKSSCKLMYFPERNSRPIDPEYQINKEQVSLADAYPILIIGEQSLADLNSKLIQPVPMNRFRPNLTFTGGEAYTEDDWGTFRIGTTILAGVKPCARCIVTTVDQETGIRGVEPLKTLSEYRKKNNKVLFGENVLVITPGEINVGDQIMLDAHQKTFHRETKEVL
jgi:uncharacterized protein